MFICMYCGELGTPRQGCCQHHCLDCCDCCDYDEADEGDMAQQIEMDEAER